MIQQRPYPSAGQAGHGPLFQPRPGAIAVGMPAPAPQAGPRPPMQQQPQPPNTGTSPLPSLPPGGPPINTNFPGISLPTRESQNQIMALAAQRANPGNAINRAVGNRGIQSSSGVILGNLAGPMQNFYREGALNAANLGIEDQLTRDEHAMRGILGLGQTDIGRLRAGARRDRIGIDAQNALSGSFADLLRALGGMFGMDDLTGGLGGLI